MPKKSTTRRSETIRKKSGGNYVFFLLDVLVRTGALQLVAQLDDFHVVLRFHDLSKHKTTWSEYIPIGQTIPIVQFRESWPQVHNLSSHVQEIRGATFDQIRCHNGTKLSFSTMGALSPFIERGGLWLPSISFKVTEWPSKLCWLQSFYLSSGHFLWK